jgi:hypothetical protein
MAVLHIGPEVLSVLCSKCKCCLADGTHCGTCHTRLSIKTLCGCGDCVNRAHDYIERDNMRIAKLAADKAAKELANAA